MHPPFISLILAFLLSLCSMAETPTGIPQPIPTETIASGSLLDQLIDSLRQDLREAPPEGKPTWPDRSISTTLQSLIHAGDPQNRRGLNEDLCQNVFVCGSKRSGDLALALIRQTQKEKAERATALDARLEEAGKSAATRLFQAKTSLEVQTLINELDTLGASHPSAINESSDSRTRFRAFLWWAKSWRDQLARREAGQNAIAIKLLLLIRLDDTLPWVDPAEAIRQVEAACIAAGKPTAENFRSQVAALGDKALAAGSPAEIDSLLSAVETFDLYQNNPTYRTENFRAQLQGLQDALIAAREGNTGKIQQVQERLRSAANYGQGGSGIPRSKFLERLGQIKPAATPQPGSGN